MNPADIPLKDQKNARDKLEALVGAHQHADLLGNDKPPTLGFAKADESLGQWHEAMRKVLRNTPPPEQPQVKKLLEGALGGMMAEMDAVRQNPVAGEIPAELDNRMLGQGQHYTKQVTLALGELGQDTPETRAWNNFSYEARVPFHEKWLSFVYDKDKAEEKGSMIAGIKPGGVLGLIGGIAGAAFMFNTSGLMGMLLLGLGALSGAYLGTVAQDWLSPDDKTKTNGNGRNPGDATQNPNLLLDKTVDDKTMLLDHEKGEVFSVPGQTDKARVYLSTPNDDDLNKVLMVEGTLTKKDGKKLFTPTEFVLAPLHKSSAADNTEALTVSEEPESAIQRKAVTPGTFTAFEVGTDGKLTPQDMATITVKANKPDLFSANTPDFLGVKPQGGFAVTEANRAENVRPPAPLQAKNIPPLGANPTLGG